MSKDQENEDLDLPASLVEVKEVIGMDGAMNLVRGFGGIRIFVPKRLRADHRLVVSLGLEAAQRLSHYFGGEILAVPRAVKALQQRRNREIISQYGRSVSVRLLAQEHQLTERQIYSILAKVP